MSIVRFDPLFRTVRDFDRMTGELLGGRSAYAPEYDIVEHGEDRFAVALAVPGFGLEELDITVKDRELQVKGEPRTEARANYVRRGIARAAFQRSFTLGDHIEIVGASLDKGILTIELERRVPEAMKPRSIQIAAPEAAKPAVESSAGEKAA
jgi:molecular chaperone IbpA